MSCNPPPQALEPTIHTFGTFSVRHVIIDGERWWHVGDCAKMGGYSTTHGFAERVRVRRLEKVETPGGPIPVNLGSEAETRRAIRRLAHRFPAEAVEWANDQPSAATVPEMVDAAFEPVVRALAPLVPEPQRQPEFDFSDVEGTMAQMSGAWVHGSDTNPNDDVGRADSLSGADIETFNFRGNSVRVLIIDGSPWWVAADVTRALGYRDASAGVRMLRDHQKGYTEVSTPGGPQQMTVVNESGLYRLVMRSNRITAEDFQDWVTGEVLPTIRKTGTYSIPRPAPTPTSVALAVPPDYPSAIESLAERLIEVAKLSRQVADLKPKAAVAERCLAPAGTYSVAFVGKLLKNAGVKTGPGSLWKQLETLGWIYRQKDNGSSRWMPKESARRFVSMRVSSGIDPGGNAHDHFQVRVHADGIYRLLELFGASAPASLPAPDDGT